MTTTDPVCGMEIESGTTDLTKSHEGRIYHFCSAQCREAFVADPARYAAAGEKGESGQSGDGQHGKHDRSGNHGCCH